MFCYYQLYSKICKKPTIHINNVFFHQGGKKVIHTKGTHTEAIIHSNSRQSSAIEQIQELCNQKFLANAKIRIMPDYHAGKGCVIGTTIQLADKVVPNLVGVDVGCGVLTVKISEEKIDFQQLDKIIRTQVPNGPELHENVQDVNLKTSFPDPEQFQAKHVLQYERVVNCFGTLGGGNHFIEVSVDEEGYHYLTIHTGSRYVGARIANYYQKVAIENLRKNGLPELISMLKEQGRHQEIQQTIKKFVEKEPVIPNDLAYLEGEDFRAYIHDMKLAQQFAKSNREEIARVIIEAMNVNVIDQFDTIHNYIDTDHMILRKGAVSAQNGERLIVPINMRDGSILAVGKGNPEWNYSAPHGAGRLLSRTQAMKTLNMDEFKSTMENVWSTSVTQETLDEAPMAYKPMHEILEKIQETADIIGVIKPVYNFKASDKFVPNWKKK